MSNTDLTVFALIIQSISSNFLSYSIILSNIYIFVTRHVGRPQNTNGLVSLRPHCPQTRRKSLCRNYCPVTVQGECLLSGGVEGCYWWKMWRARDLLYYIQTEYFKKLRVAYSECTCTVYCGHSDNILDWITCDLRMSSVRKYTRAYLSVVCSLVMKQMTSGWLVATRYSWLNVALVRISNSQRT
jgi:hypothetical protein